MKENFFGTQTTLFFDRVVPEGVITIQRRSILKHDIPKWDMIDKKLLPLHITSNGTIDTNGAGLLQVDFANKYCIHSANFNQIFYFNKA